MENAALLQKLAEFFIGEFENDPASVAEWILQGDDDVDQFVDDAKAAMRGDR